MAIFTKFYCKTLLEDSVILPQEILKMQSRKLKN